MEHNTQHNIISDSMIDAAENIRKVEIADAKAIVDIYNYYVENTAISFETEALTVNEMAERIKDISSKFPYFVYDNGSLKFEITAKRLYAASQRVL